MNPVAFNLTFHIIFCAFGGAFSYFIISLNLLLIVNISRTTKFVVKATFLHIDQLVLTLVLTVFLIYTYSIIIADHYHESFDYGGDEDLDMCRD